MAEGKAAGAAGGAVSTTDERLGRQTAGLILDAIDEGVYGVDVEGRITFLNPAAAAMLGWAYEEAVGADMHTLVHHSRPDGSPYPVADCPIQDACRRGVSHAAEDEVLWSRAGQPIPVTYTATPLRENGELVGGVVVFKDIRVRLELDRERLATNERLAHLARHDELTGLVGRAFFLDRLDHALARAERVKWAVALMFVDLDRFKAVNDTLGHDAGDLVLRHVATCLQSSVRGADTVARLGGDEFMILMEEVEEAQAAGAAQRIEAALARPFGVLDHELSMRSSIGVAMFPRDGTTQAELRKAADAAMYRAKLDPDHGFRFFTSDMSAAARERMELVEALGGAVERGELELEYQPQVDLVSGETVSVEAYMRWRRPGHGLLEAARWVPAAESAGLIVAMGQWALRAACERVRSWRDAGHDDLRVAVNVGARELYPGDFPDSVRRLLDEYGMHPNELEIEVADDALSDEAASALVTLRGLGVTVVLDDFGTGRIAARALAALPLDVVKIDGAIVANLEDGRSDRALARSVIQLAHDIGLRVYAEGVETEGQRAFLRDNGCDAAEGYLISHPLSPESLERWLAE